MNHSVEKLQDALQKEFGLENKVFELGTDVVFFGSELDCYRLAYKMKCKENQVRYSKARDTWCISFPTWFSPEFSQKIVK